jgi:hypothetical protein
MSKTATHAAAEEQKAKEHPEHAAHHDYTVRRQRAQTSQRAGLLRRRAWRAHCVRCANAGARADTRRHALRALMA